MNSRLDDITEDESSFMHGMTSIRLVWSLSVEVRRNGDEKPEVVDMGPVVYDQHFLSDSAIDNADLDIIAYSVERQLHRAGTCIKEEYRQRFAASIASQIRTMRMQWSYNRGTR